MGLTLQDDGTTKIWKPHYKQERFLELPRACFEGFYGGAAGGGKSELLVAIPIVKGFYKHPQFHGVIFRRTFPQLEESLIPRSRELYQSVGGKYDKSKHVWSFPSGATIRFSHLDSDDDARKHDTAEYQYVAFDELTHFTEFMYTYIAASRVRSTIPEIPAMVRSASNPGNIGHAWVRKRFVEDAPEGGKLLHDPRSNTFRCFISAKLTDNPHLMNDDPNYINRLSLLPEAERRAKVDGDWWTFMGQVFTEWRSQHFMGEPEHACHVCTPFVIPAWWPKILFLDWGYRHMMYAGWLALGPDKRVFLYREYAARKEKIAIWGSIIRKLSAVDKNIVAFELDPSAWQERGQHQTIAQQIENEVGMAPSRANNDRLGGKHLLHEFLRWEEKTKRDLPSGGYDDETAQRINRLYGVDAYYEYQRMFTEDPPESNLPKFQVFNTCEVFIDCIPTLVYDDSSKSMATDKVEDVKKMDGDDPFDAIRYGLFAVDRVYLGLPELAKRIERLADIHRSFEATKDMTSFYMQMEKYEAETVTPVALRRGKARRFH